ncbi:MAG: aminotransferase class V-fold PLP-dependent enzyme [Acidimicrobiales bacterium]
MRIAEAQALWDAEPGWLDTASYGLPPLPAWEALQAALADWRRGAASWESWTVATESARTSFARLVNAKSTNVCIGSATSELIGLIAASLPDRARVVVPEIEFTSNLFPWLVQAERGVEVVTVPACRLAEAIDARTTMVAYSAVQSSTGEIADTAAIAAAANSYGALTVVDATQACGWLRLDASEVDALVCGAYKWLMSPRGTAFASLSERLAAQVRPNNAGWYAGEDIHDSYYGPPLRLATSARRFDVSPAWFSWVGTSPALELLEEIGVEAIHAHDVALANRFCAGLGLPAADSAIVSCSLEGAAGRLGRAGIRTTTRAGRLRASFHLYNTAAEVDAALDALS